MNVKPSYLWWARQGGYNMFDWRGKQVTTCLTDACNGAASGTAPLSNSLCLPLSLLHMYILYTYIRCENCCMDEVFIRIYGLCVHLRGMFDYIFHRKRSLLDLNVTVHVIYLFKIFKSDKQNDGGAGNSGKSRGLFLVNNIQTPTPLFEMRNVRKHMKNKFSDFCDLQFLSHGRSNSLST